MPDPMPPDKQFQAIQDAFDAPRGQPRAMHERTWADKLGPGLTITLAGLGVFLIIPSQNRARGSTLSAKLRWEQRSQEIQQTIDRQQGRDASQSLTDGTDIQ